MTVSGVSVSGAASGGLNNPGDYAINREAATAASGPSVAAKAADYALLGPRRKRSGGGYGPPTERDARTAWTIGRKHREDVDPTV
jgi:hypothetical protein